MLNTSVIMLHVVDKSRLLLLPLLLLLLLLLPPLPPPPPPPPLLLLLKTIYKSHFHIWDSRMLHCRHIHTQKMCAPVQKLVYPLLKPQSYSRFLFQNPKVTIQPCMLCLLPWILQFLVLPSLLTPFSWILLTHKVATDMPWTLNQRFILVLISTPHWGAADAEIKVPPGENTELKHSPYKA